MGNHDDLLDLFRAMKTVQTSCASAGNPGSHSSARFSTDTINLMKFSLRKPLEDYIAKKDPASFVRHGSLLGKMELLLAPELNLLRTIGFDLKVVDGAAGEDYVLCSMLWRTLQSLAKAELWALSNEKGRHPSETEVRIKLHEDLHKELRLKALTIQQWVFRKGFPATLLDPAHSDEALGVALMAAQHGAPTGCSSEMGPVFAALACRLLK